MTIPVSVIASEAKQSQPIHPSLSSFSFRIFEIYQVLVVRSIIVQTQG
jgi:hypothetical protein